jgi:hypothetical protein
VYIWVIRRGNEMTIHQRLRDHAAWLIRTARGNGGNVSIPTTWDQRAADIAASRGNGVVQFWGGSKPVLTLRRPLIRSVPA